MNGPFIITTVAFRNNKPVGVLDPVRRETMDGLSDFMETNYDEGWRMRTHNVKEGMIYMLLQSNENPTVFRRVYAREERTISDEPTVLDRFENHRICEQI